MHRNVTVATLMALITFSSLSGCGDSDADRASNRAGSPSPNAATSTVDPARVPAPKPTVAPQPAAVPKPAPIVAPAKPKTDPDASSTLSLEQRASLEWAQRNSETYKVATNKLVALAKPSTQPAKDQVIADLTMALKKTEESLANLQKANGETWQPRLREFQNAIQENASVFMVACDVFHANPLELLQ